MTAPAIPLCAAPDAHPTTCPCPTPVPVVQVQRPRVGTWRGRRVEDVTWRAPAPAATTETSDMTDQPDIDQPNGEDCPRCSRLNLPYPFICQCSPGRTAPDNPAASGDAADNPAWTWAQAVTARRTLTDLREQYAAAIREVCGDGPWEVIVQRSTDAIMAIRDDDMDATEDEMERRSRVITGLEAQLQKAQAALPDRAQAAIRTLEQQVEVRDRQLAEVRAELATARATIRRLNYRAQNAEHIAAVFKRAVGDWEWNEKGTYVPLRSLTAIAKAVGLKFDSARLENHIERVKRLEAELAAVQAEPPAPDATHRYLSTACLHGEHAYCQSNTGLAGAKIPAVCKFCQANCSCPCHRVTP